MSKYLKKSLKIEVGHLAGTEISHTLAKTIQTMITSNTIDKMIVRAIKSGELGARDFNTVPAYYRGSEYLKLLEQGLITKEAYIDRVPPYEVHKMFVADPTEENYEMLLDKCGDKNRVLTGDVVRDVARNTNLRYLKKYDIDLSRMNVNSWNAVLNERFSRSPKFWTKAFVKYRGLVGNTNVIREILEDNIILVDQFSREELVKKFGAKVTCVLLAYRFRNEPEDVTYMDEDYVESLKMDLMEEALFGGKQKKYTKAVEENVMVLEQYIERRKKND